MKKPIWGALVFVVGIILFVIGMWGRCVYNTEKSYEVVVLDKMMIPINNHTVMALIIQYKNGSIGDVSVTPASYSQTHLGDRVVVLKTDTQQLLVEVALVISLTVGIVAMVVGFAYQTFG